MHDSDSIAALDLVLAWRHERAAFAGTHGNALGSIAFDEHDSSTAVGPGATPALRLPQLHPCETVVQVWSAAGPVVRSRHAQVSLASDGRLAFGSLDVESTSIDLERCAEDAYRALLDALDAAGYPHLLRVWNFFPAINDADDGLERYRRFNIGRQQAFAARGRTTGVGAPAASALGSRNGPLAVRFLAAKQAPRSIENPRQVSAYDYPAQYGPRSPTFSRAALTCIGMHDVLFISGTASIVGHASLHPGDVRAQTLESLRNIEAVIAEANRVQPKAGFTTGKFDWIAYVRHAADLAAVRDEIECHPGVVAARVTYVRADICRAELLVEIEAVGAV